MEVDREVLKGHIDTIILALLHEKSLYGYELAKNVRERSQQQFELKEGTMYVALKRLESKGMISSYWGADDQSEGGRRKYYQILPQGMELLRHKKREWETITSIMKFFFEGVSLS